MTAGSKNLPHMPWFVRDYLMDTPHLTTAQHGAYLLLLGNAWIQGGYLPNDDMILASMAKATDAEWMGLKPVVMAFWTLTKRGWKQKRLLEELHYVSERQNRYKIAGKKGGMAKASKQRKINGSDAKAMLGLGSSDALPSHTHTHTHTQKEEITPLVPLGGEKQSRGTKLPDNFPDEWCMARAIDYWAKHHRDDIDVAEQAVQFRAHHEARGTTSKKWEASWQTWYMNALKFNKPTIKPQTQLTDWDEVARRHDALQKGTVQ